MTASEAVAYIENYTWSTTRLGLDQTRALLAAMGDPQKELKFIHVAGSNGKGSTCAMLASILRKAGYRVGLYTSPYIEDFCEQVCDIVADRGWDISEVSVSEGLRDVKWPARMEVLSRSPLFILDGGHNPQCAEVLVMSQVVVETGGIML